MMPIPKGVRTRRRVGGLNFCSKIGEAEKNRLLRRLLPCFHQATYVPMYLARLSLIAEEVHKIYTFSGEMGMLSMP